MPSSEIQMLLHVWRTAERELDSSHLDTAEVVTGVEAVNHARKAYLDAVQERAARYGYAAGTRTIQSDIADLREAEDRRATMDRGTPEFEAAASDVHQRTDRIVIQIDTDHTQSLETAEGLRRLMGLPPKAIPGAGSRQDHQESPE
jgi:hypothetical protein